MKYMIISDIHGNIENLNKVLDIYSKEHCSKLLVLGDLFNYVIDLNRQDIIHRLNMMKDNIIAVSGNCDINTRGIEFYMPSINNIDLNNKTLLLTHGHSFTKEHLLKGDADIIFLGHTHIPEIEKINDKLFVNPGSISKSRRGENSFSIVDDNSITIRNLNNEILEEYKFTS